MHQTRKSYVLEFEKVGPLLIIVNINDAIPIGFTHA